MMAIDTLGGGGGEEVKEQIQFLLTEIEQLRANLSEINKDRRASSKSSGSGSSNPDVSKALSDIADRIMNGMAVLLEAQRKADRENFERMLEFARLTGNVGDDGGDVDDEINLRLAEIDAKNAERQDKFFNALASLIEKAFVRGSSSPGAGGGVVVK